MKIKKQATSRHESTLSSMIADFVRTEDLEFDSRAKYYKDQQKDWVEQQKREKEWRDSMDKHEENLSAKQTLEVNRMRQMMEENQKQKKQVIQNTTKEENLILAQQKKDKEERERLQRIKEEQDEVKLLLERGRKRPYGGV